MWAIKAGLVGLLFSSTVNAYQYGYNHVTTRKNPELIAANFKDVDIELLSPAFLNSEGIQPGFANGTQGPTSQDDLGESAPYDYLSPAFLTFRRGFHRGFGI